MRTRTNPPSTKPIKPPRSIMGVSKNLRVCSFLGQTYAVDGEAVANAYAPFSGGAHHLWARFVPDGEFWIDSRLKGAGRFIAAHEWFEYILMRRLSWPYPKAHNSANALEADLRKAWKAGKRKSPQLAPIWFKHLSAHLPMFSTPNRLKASIVLAQDTIDY